MKSLIAILFAASALAQSSKYVSVSAPRVILEHVEVIDGTGAAPVPDRNVVIENGDSGAVPGPNLDVTGPYLDNVTAEEARQTVEFWAKRGATSFKAQEHLARCAARRDR